LTLVQMLQQLKRFNLKYKSFYLNINPTKILLGL